MTLSAITMALPTATTVDAPMRLVTDHGVELRADEQVFLLFAALNALGYAEETERKGPPLRAPVFHDIRVDVREQLRKSKDKPSMGEIKALFEKNPAKIEAYLKAVLGRGTGKLNGTAAKLEGKLKSLDTFRNDAELKAIFDKVASAQRNHAKKLKKLLEEDFAATAKQLGLKKFKAPLSLVVVPNPLDGHAIVRSVKVGKTRYLIVGPGFASARRTVLKASLRPLMASYAKASYAKGKRFARHWTGLKTSKRFTRRYPNGEAYLAETLTRAIAYRVRAKLNKKMSRDADEDFIDEQAKNGLRWARAVLKLLDKHKEGESFEEALPKLLAKAQI